MEERDADGRIALSRCLQAMELSVDVVERRALWRAAIRYSQKGRQDRGDDLTAALPVRALALTERRGEARKGVE